LGAVRTTNGIGREEVLLKIYECATSFLPPLCTLSIIRSFSGARAYTEDAFPLLGEADERLFLIGALGADGVCLAPILAKMLVNSMIRGKNIPSPLLPKRMLS
jgi:glycine/D-amino acid oxidase-like deaminating enzyme